jgi:hypothetical protein
LGLTSVPDCRESSREARRSALEARETEAEWRRRGRRRSRAVEAAGVYRSNELGSGCEGGRRRRQPRLPDGREVSAAGAARRHPCVREEEDNEGEIKDKERE